MCQVLFLILYSDTKCMTKQLQVFDWSLFNIISWSRQKLRTTGGLKVTEIISSAIGAVEISFSLIWSTIPSVAYI